MYSRVICGTLIGTEAEEIIVETDVSFGFPSFSIVGLPDAAIRESKERVRISLGNSGLEFPDRRVTVNLSPAGVKKEGTHFDLAIAVGILVSSGIISKQSIDGIAFLGELTFDGKVNRINGALPLIMGLKEKGIKRLVIPNENRVEASMVGEIDVFTAETLSEVLDFIAGKRSLHKVEFNKNDIFINGNYEKIPDYADVSGHESAKRALQIAATAMHNILLTGPPGSGKTLLARCLPGILPPLTYEEKLEITKIYSIYGLLDEQQPIINHRPFRAPDHTVTAAALIGGGNRIKIGEVSLAHLGVLFLDEFPEFSRSALEALRKPLEDKICTISRVSGSVTLPSRFILVAAMNPCPCGFLGDPRNECRCTEAAIVKYKSKISGPLMDRIDITVNVHVPLLDDIKNTQKGMSSAQMREEVLNARKIQEERFAEELIAYNSQMEKEHIDKYCRLNYKAQKTLDDAFNRFKLSVRSYQRIIKVARTIADMEGAENIQWFHIAEAVSYKCEN